MKPPHWRKFTPTVVLGLLVTGVAGLGVGGLLTPTANGFVVTADQGLRQFVLAAIGRCQ